MQQQQWWPLWCKAPLVVFTDCAPELSCWLLLPHTQGPPPQLEAECGGRHFSRGMREVVASCLNKDPAKRPTAKQLLSKG